MSKTRTVRDIMNITMKVGKKRTLNFPLFAIFCENLAKLGWARRTKEPEDCTDVYATAELSEEEYQDLLTELICTFIKPPTEIHFFLRLLGLGANR